MLGWPPPPPPGSPATLVLLQGNALEEDVLAFIKAGCSAVVTKPFLAAELFAALELHLSAAELEVHATVAGGAGSGIELERPS